VPLRLVLLLLSTSLTTVARLRELFEKTFLKPEGEGAGDGD